MPSFQPYGMNEYWVYDYSHVGEPPFRHRKRLRLEWELPGDRITDDCLPHERDAVALYAQWLADVESGAVSGMGARGGWLPIRWRISSPDGNVAESAPFQPVDPPPRDFLSHFTWPRHHDTDEPLNWLRVPVADKRWVINEHHNGGFVQEVTGWKPSPLQPLVHIMHFTKAVP